MVQAIDTCRSVQEEIVRWGAIQDAIMADRGWADASGYPGPADAEKSERDFPILDKKGLIRCQVRALRQLSAPWWPRVDFRVPILSDTGSDNPGSPEQ
eukprot:8989290-Pyramimonas_sp.AAC.1